MRILLSILFILFGFKSNSQKAIPDVIQNLYDSAKRHSQNNDHKTAITELDSAILLLEKEWLFKSRYGIKVLTEKANEQEIEEQIKSAIKNSPNILVKTSDYLLKISAKSS